MYHSRQIKTISKDHKKIKISFFESARQLILFLSVSYFLRCVCHNYIVWMLSFLCCLLNQQKQSVFLILLTHSPYCGIFQKLRNLGILSDTYFVFWFVWNYHWTAWRNVFSKKNVASVSFPVHNQVAVAFVSCDVDNVLFFVKMLEF